MKWRIDSENLRRLIGRLPAVAHLAQRVDVAMTIGLLADLLVFDAMIAGGTAVEAAQTVSFAAATALIYMLARAVLASTGHTWDAPVHGRLALVSVMALFLPAWFSSWAGISYANESLTGQLILGGVLVTVANVLLQSRWLEPKALTSDR